MSRLEKLFYNLFSSAIAIAIYLLQITPETITNFDNVLLGTITLNSIGIGFLIASVSMMPTLNQNLFYKKLKDLKTDEKLLGILVVTIRLLLCISIVSVVLLFTNTLKMLQDYSVWLFYLWTFMLTYSLLLINSVVKIYLKVIKSIYKNKAK